MSAEGFNIEQMKKEILADSTLNEQQKQKLLSDLKKQFPKNPNEKTVNVKVEVDSNTLKEMAIENAELRAKIGETDVEIANAVRQKLKEKFESLGFTAPKLDNKTDMDSATEILRALQKKNDPRENTGVASLEGQYIGTQKEVGYETHEAMIDALRFQEKYGETEEIKKNATDILNQLMRKWVNAKKDDPNLLDKITYLETPNEYRKRTRRKREQ